MKTTGVLPVHFTRSTTAQANRVIDDFFGNRQVRLGFFVSEIEISRFI